MTKRYRLMKPSINKYKFTGHTMQYQGRTLYRIQALRSFNDVKVGDLGGWIESYDNLSQFDDAWVYDEAKVYGHSTEIFGNAIISGDAIVEFNKDYMVLKNNWSNNEYFTYTHSNKQYVVKGFNYTTTELIEKAYEDSQLDGDCYKNIVESVERLYTIFDQQNYLNKNRVSN